MNQKSRSLVADFLLESVPPVALDAYGIVAELKYPLADKHSLSIYLDDLGNKSKHLAAKDRLAINLVRAAFDGGDFPIQTARGGLEKFQRKLSRRFDSNLFDEGESGDFRADPGDFGKGPKFNALEYFKGVLDDPDGCAASCAVAHYDWAMRPRHDGSFPDAYSARRRGETEGRWCQATGFCRAFPRPPGVRPGPPLFYCHPGFVPPPPIEVPFEGPPFP